MTTGIVILGITAVLLFFGAAERYFDRLGMTSWLTFLIVLALIIGAVMPEVHVGALVMTVGGFGVPLVAFIILLAIAGKEGNMLRSILALVVVAAIAVSVRMITGLGSTGAVVAFYLLCGFVGGAAAAGTAGDRIGALAAVFGGCIAGDAISMAVIRSSEGGGIFTVGGYGIFNAMIIGAASALLVAEAVGAVRRAAENRRIAFEKLTAEAAEDVDVKETEADTEAAEDFTVGEHSETKDGERKTDDNNDIYGGD